MRCHCPIEHAYLNFAADVPGPRSWPTDARSIELLVLLTPSLRIRVS